MNVVDDLLKMVFNWCILLTMPSKLLPPFQHADYFIILSPIWIEYKQPITYFRLSSILNSPICIATKASCDILTNNEAMCALGRLPLQ
jgi:hypothetical protein